MTRSRRQDGIVATMADPAGASTASGSASAATSIRIGPGRRSGDDPGPGQHATLLVRVEVEPEQPADAARAEGHLAVGRLVGRAVDPPDAQRPTGPLEHEPRTAVGPDPGEVERLTLLEPETRLRPQTVALAGPADADRVEDRRLDDHVRRVRPDLGCHATHDPGDGDRSPRVGDHEGVLGERPVDVVERLEPLAGGGSTDDDPAVVDGRGVERVDRLAELEHDVVARIDDVAHRPHPGGEQPGLDKLG